MPRVLECGVNALEIREGGFEELGLGLGLKSASGVGFSGLYGLRFRV